MDWRGITMLAFALLSCTSVHSRPAVELVASRAVQAFPARGTSVTVDLTGYLNSKAASMSPGSGGDFNTCGWTYPAANLPSGNFQYRNQNFTLPDFTTTGNDNVVASNQTISLPSGRYSMLSVLAAADYDYLSNNLTVEYEDGSLEYKSFFISPFRPNFGSYRVQRGVINTPYTFFGVNHSDNNSTGIYYASASLDSFKNISSVSLSWTAPNNCTDQDSSPGRVHIFAMSLFTAESLSTTASGPAPVFQYVRSTTKSADTNRSTAAIGVQYFEVALSNLAGNDDISSWITTPHTVEIQSSSVNTVVSATVLRLRAGDSVRLMVGVMNVAGVQRGAAATAVAIMRDSSGSIVATSDPFNVTAGIPVYTSDTASLEQHESPTWYDDAKLGIFVHWGVYAVPAFAPVGEEYAEWYWWQMHVPNNRSSPTWSYHKETYGEEVVYDDFIQNFTASKFQAKDFVDLFAASGAKYFVQVSKHHDGIAIFDTKNTSNRNLVQLGPKRDLLKEILDYAKEAHPELRRGAYFSMPEWYHPDYVPYGIGQANFYRTGNLSDGTITLHKSAWPGGPTHNAYNYSQIEPFTGYVKAPTNYIVDIQAPQMEILTSDYGIEILWCDIGGANNTAAIAPGWFNQAYDSGYSVMLNDRCGIPSYDIATPEYSRFADVQEDKWESNAGLDPFSYGYNAQTPPDRYANATVTIQSLVDIVSKNGNFLVDIGPREDGTIVQEEIDTLTGVGDWLQYAGPAIYGTKFWAYAPQEGDNLRFTTTDSAFYIISLVEPDPTSGIHVQSPVPIMTGDQIVLLGGTGKPIEWMAQDDGSFLLLPTEAELNQVEHAWAFQIAY